MSTPEWFTVLVVGFLGGMTVALIRITDKLDRVIRLLEIGNDINNRQT